MGRKGSRKVQGGGALQVKRGRGERGEKLKGGKRERGEKREERENQR